MFIIQKRLVLLLFIFLSIVHVDARQTQEPVATVSINAIGSLQYNSGPFAGQLFVGEMNSARIVRVMLEKVAGELQGACIPFIDGKGLLKGNNRLAFAPDGSL